MSSVVGEDVARPAPDEDRSWPKSLAAQAHGRGQRLGALQLLVVVAGDEGARRRSGTSCRRERRRPENPAKPSTCATRRLPRSRTTRYSAAARQYSRSAPRPSRLQSPESASLRPCSGQARSSSVSTTTWPRSAPTWSSASGRSSPPGRASSRGRSAPPPRQAPALERGAQGQVHAVPVEARAVDLVAVRREEARLVPVGVAGHPVPEAGQEQALPPQRSLDRRAPRRSPRGAAPPARRNRTCSGCAGGWSPAPSPTPCTPARPRPGSGERPSREGPRPPRHSRARTPSTSARRAPRRRSCRTRALPSPSRREARSGC